METIDIIIVIVYLFAIVLVGLLAQKKASEGIDSFFLGNRKLPWWVLGASGMASNTDIAGTMIKPPPIPIKAARIPTITPIKIGNKIEIYNFDFLNLILKGNPCNQLC